MKLLSHGYKAQSFVLSLFILSFAAIPCACLYGQFDISLQESVTVLLDFFTGSPVQGMRESTILNILINIRLPRVLAAMLCGGGLALAGAILQGALRNPLADPFTLGISAGAACAASLVIALPIHAVTGLDQNILVSAAAMFGAMFALFATILLGRGTGTLDRESIILAGVAVAAFLGALIALIKALNEESVTSIVFWIMGSLQGITWRSLPILLITLAPGLVAAIWGWRKLDAISLGDEESYSLGINAGMARLYLLLGASLMTAGCVSIAGIIGFVGLVAPHMLRILMGPGHGLLMGASFPAGALLLLCADCIGRSILSGGQELPVGVVTALLGGPFFAWLVWKRASK